MKFQLIRPAAIDGNVRPAGASVDDCAAGTIDSLRRAGLLRVTEFGEPASEPALPVAAEEDALVDDVAAGGTSEPGDTETAEPAEDADAEILLDQLGVPSGVLEILHRNELHTLGDAQGYYSEHGSFEPLKGIGKTRCKELAVLLGLA